MKRLYLAAMTLALSACGPMTAAPPVSPGSSAPVPAIETPVERASAAVDIAVASYQRIRAWSVRIEPYLPATWLARLTAARVIADRAMTGLVAAQTLAEQAEAIRTLDAATGGILRAAQR